VLAERWDFIDRVVVGSTANMNLTIQAVKAFFTKQSMNVEISPSNIPYRDW